MNVIFAAHAISKRLVRGTFTFDDKTFVTSRRILEGIDDKATNHWIKSLGTFAISSLQQASTYLITWEEKNDTVVNPQEERVLRRLNSPYHGLLLTDMQISFSGDSSRFVGEGRLEENNIAVTSIKTIQPLIRLEKPFYERQTEYRKSINRDFDNLNLLLNKWKEITLHLDKIHDKGSIYSAFSDALESFREGKAPKSPLTAIARFVESAEAIIAIPRKNDGSIFPERAMKFIPHLINHPYLNFSKDQLFEQLRKIYKIRNNRNHGKGMADQVPLVYGLAAPASELGEELDLQVGKSFYIAEQLARFAIRYAITDLNILNFLKSRSILEKAWLDGLVIR